jgi:hypothetical protein
MCFGLLEIQRILWKSLCSRGCFWIAFCSTICHFELQTNQTVIYKQRVTLLYIYIPNLNVPPNNTFETNITRKSPEKHLYFVSQIVLTYYEKILFTFEIRGWRPRICKSFDISRTIYSNSEMSEQVFFTRF